MRDKRTWIVIADGAHAKVMQHSADESGIEDVEGLAFDTDLPRTHDIVSDRAGRSFESHGHARHAKTGRSDPHRELKRSFAHKVAEVLAAGLAGRRYDQLILVAPPVTLGDLREALGKEVRARVKAEIAHDLIKTPKARLLRHLADVLPMKPSLKRSVSARPALPKQVARKR